MKKLLLLLLFFPALMSAQKEKALVVNVSDGTAVYFLLEEKPLITFVDDAVKIVSATNEATIKRSLVKDFRFVDELPTGIEDLEDAGENLDNGRYELSRNSIYIEGLSPGCIVRLFSLKGETIITETADEEGSVTISFDTLPSGIYVVNYNETAIKFIKS